MQGLVLVDRDGKALRRPMSYMDQRAGREMKQTQGLGVTISGVNAKIMLRSLIITHAASTSVKDPLWKYKWVEANEPDIFAKVYKWLDVKEYLICRCTGECVMTEDSAYSTFLYDTRPGKEGWNRELCGYYKVNPEHLPKIIRCTDVAGKLTEKAASELGLKAGTPKSSAEAATPRSSASEPAARKSAARTFTPAPRAGSARSRTGRSSISRR
jgi:xylulokinase